MDLPLAITDVRPVFCGRFYENFDQNNRNMFEIRRNRDQKRKNRVEIIFLKLQRKLLGDLVGWHRINKVLLVGENLQKKMRKFIEKHAKSHYFLQTNVFWFDN